MRTILLTVLVLASFAATAFDIAVNGKPAAEIVLAKEANQSQRLAAEDLRKFIREISGAELKIVDAPTDEFKNRIYVGANAFTRKLGFVPTKFNSSGYQIFVKGNMMVLSGSDRLASLNSFKEGRPEENLRKWQAFTGEPFSLAQINNGAGIYNPQMKLYVTDDTGTWYAASALLEQLGVRFYAPYEDGTVIPTLKTIPVREQDTRVEAAFGRRHWHAGRNDPEGIAWLKRNMAGNNTLIEFNHMMYAITTSSEFHAKYPQFYAQESPGKFYAGFPAGSGMPRLTDPDFRNMSVKLAGKVFDAFPDLKAICMGVPDGGLKLDYRDIGRYKGSLEQQGSDILWDFTVYLAKAIRKSHPGKYLIYMPYGGCRLVPDNRKPDDPDNIILGYPVRYSAYRVENYLDREIFQRLKEWDDFLKPSTKNVLWDYFLYYRWKHYPRYPVFFTKYLQSEMQRLLPFVDGKFIEIPSDYHSNGIPLKQPEAWRIGESAAMSLMMYWQNKLFWNPNLDREAMLNEYYRLFFGPAEKEMKEFHEFAEAVWTRQESRSVTSTTGFLKELDVDKYFEILNRALAKTEKNSVHRRRIERLVKAYSPLKTLFPNLKRTGPALRAYEIPENAPLDGNPGKYTGGFSRLRYKNGQFTKLNKTDFKIALTKNGKYLYFIAIAYENRMAHMKSRTVDNDKSSIFEDDLIELYLNTPRRSYFKICVNPAGARWDESTDATIIERDTLPLLWNPDIQTFVKKFPDRWVVEMKIPTADFESARPTKIQPWGIQIARTRMAGDATEFFAFGCGPGKYSNLPQWGNLWMR